MNSFVSRFFPLPRYLAMEGGGIEISDRSIKYVRLAKRGGEIRMVSFGEVVLPHEAIVDGEIRSSDALVQTLALVRRRCRFALCHTSLPESRGYLFTAQVPREEEKSGFSDTLALALASHVPLAPAEAVFDGEMILEEGSGEEATIVAAAVGEDLAAAYARAFKEAGFLALSFELEPQAAARAVGLPNAGIIVDFGEVKSILCVIENGRPRFTTSGAGSASLDGALATLGWSADRIIQYKEDIGVTEKGAAGEQCLHAADALASEITRLASYWNAHGSAHASHSRVERVVLYGGNANIKGLAEYLARTTGIQTERAGVEHLFAAHRSHALPKDQIPRFTTAIGLALRSL